jgi:hypothetical protein
VTLSDAGVAAVTYAGGWGWRVFPIRPDDKRPATERGFHDATTDSASVFETWMSRPSSNVGVATGEASGIVVIDVDPGGDGTIRRLTATLGPLPTTMVARTPRGWHVYLRHPGLAVRCSVAALGEGVDVRGDGGYVVAPPSRIGASLYRWVLSDGRTEPVPSDLPDVPAPWVDALTARKGPKASSDGDVNYIRAAVAAELESVRTAVEGTRNSQLNASAFALARFVVAGRVSESDVVRLLVAAAIESGLPEDEARRTIRSAFDGRRAAA